jgi:perosamine synthetase
VYWMYPIELTDDFPASRSDLMASLSDAGIGARTFFCPMNLQPFLRDQPGARPIDCPVAERVWETGLYLPSSTTLTSAEIEQVVSAIRTAAG